MLKPGQRIEQYVYLDNDIDYKLEYWHNGSSRLKIVVENVQAVTGQLTLIAEKESKSYSRFVKEILDFRSGKEYLNNTKTIRISVTNESAADAVVDDLTIKKTGY
ncbi:hypothetical protein LWM68_09080 [Niabella sp. W65]|nr:hypothetical protein [Niabella sp. W65]MCH7362908.1 hypothetical protein [Niabella sp. W65]ULT38857.1 hypothetical protein KRR40_27765 [Niabella sp. I65]